MKLGCEIIKKLSISFLRQRSILDLQNQLGAGSSLMTSVQFSVTVTDGPGQSRQIQPIQRRKYGIRAHGCLPWENRATVLGYQAVPTRDLAHLTHLNRECQLSFATWSTPLLFRPLIS